jgi:hypothetical protein
MPLHHHEDHETEDFRPHGARTMKPIDEAQREAFHRPRIEPADADPKVKKATAKLAKMIAADAPASVIARCRAAVESARTDILERHAVARANERTKTLAAQREKVRLKDGLMPSVTVNFGPLQIVVSPGRSPDHTMRAFAYRDLHQALQIVASQAGQVAGLAQNAETPLQVLPVDVDTLRRELGDVMLRSIRAGLMFVEVI